MTYNFKHIRLFENSPFKKISKSEKPADDLSAVRKVSANIIKENLSEKLYYILHLFYYHLLLINRGEKIKSITLLTGEKLLITGPTEELDKCQTEWFKLFCLRPSLDYSFRDLEYVKNNVIIRTTENGLYIKLPCIIDSYYHFNITIVNPRNTMTVKDVYVNQLKYILQYGYKDKNVQKYYEFLLDYIEDFDEEKSGINISEIFNDIHEYLKFCSGNIDIKYITNNNYNKHLRLNLIDIQSIDDVNESFLSIFEPRSFIIDYIGIIMVNSFVMSTDFAEVKKLLQQITTSGIAQYLASFVDNDTKRLLKNIYTVTGLTGYRVSAGSCENMTMYDHCELNDLSIISKCIKNRVFISVGNPKKCSFRTDILNSIPNSATRVGSHLRFLKKGGTISKFDILKAVTDNSSYDIGITTKKRNDKVLSSERVKNNTNNDDYSKFIKSFEINNFSRFKDILCSVVAAGA